MSVPDFSRKTSSTSNQNEVNEDERMKTEMQSKFNRIQIFSSDEEKRFASINNKLALTAFTNDTAHSDTERRETEEVKNLHTQLNKLEGMLSKLSTINEDDLNGMILKSLENIHSKLECIVPGNSTNTNDKMSKTIHNDSAKTSCEKCLKNKEKVKECKETINGYVEVI